MDDILSHQGVSPTQRQILLQHAYPLNHSAAVSAVLHAPGATFTRYRVLGLGGYKRHGKDTLADFLVAEHGWVKFGMSDALHAFLMAQNPWVKVELPIYYTKPRGDDPSKVWVDHINAGTYRYEALTAILGYERCKDEIPDYRHILKVTGTEAMRGTMWEDSWIRKASDRIRDLQANGQKNIAVTGIRFPNELGMIEQFGISAWITRENYETPADSHDSENSVTAADFDQQYSAATLSELKAHAAAIHADYTLWEEQAS